MSYAKLIDKILAIPPGHVMDSDGFRDHFPELREDEFQDILKYAFGAAITAGLFH